VTDKTTKATPWWIAMVAALGVVLALYKAKRWLFRDDLRWPGSPEFEAAHPRDEMTGRWLRA
jgi:hypothetical protein